MVSGKAEMGQDSDPASNLGSFTPSGCETVGN